MNAKLLAMALIRPRRRQSTLRAPDKIILWRDQKLAVNFLGDRTAPRRVLLVHGWEADHHDMVAIAEALAAHGMFCVMPDLPAHGASSGKTVVITEAADALLRVDAEHGPFDLCIGHSVGSAVVLIAATLGLHAAAIVTLTPPGNYVQQMHHAARSSRATESQIAEAMDVLRERCPDLDRLDGPEMAAAMTIPGLVVVAGRDETLDPECGRKLCAAWPSARLLDVPHATHTSVLTDEEVLHAIGALMDTTPAQSRRTRRGQAPDERSSVRSSPP